MTSLLALKADNNAPAQKISPPPDDQVVLLFFGRKSLRRTKASKTPGPDDMLSHVLRDCAEELTDVFWDIFNTLAEPSCCPVPQSHHHHPGRGETISFRLQ